ncbi:hypothetical protein ABZ816_09280 [Actinosynnema sp. NPDC047251]|nr:hypothetical protein [Saccharothrix espanaensis]
MERAVGGVNAGVEALRVSPRWGRYVGRHITSVTYVGRRSGRTFSTPVGYRRTGDVVVIGVRLPDAKTWWRNFTGDGGPLSLVLDGRDRTGHGVARRDPKGRVTISVRLDEPA